MKNLLEQMKGLVKKQDKEIEKAQDTFKELDSLQSQLLNSNGAYLRY